MRNPLQKYSGDNVASEGRASPYPTHRLAGEVSLVDTAREIERAHESIARQTHAQLGLIAEQIRHLQEQAKRIVAEADENLKLHQARCSFRRLPGQAYHLYQKDSVTFFSLLSPDDYGGAPPHHYLGTYRLESDDSFTLLIDSNGKPTQR